MQSDAPERVTPAEVDESTPVLNKSVITPPSLPYLHLLRSVAAGVWPLGWIAFGGPSAHISLFHQRFVATADAWLDEDTFLELYALCASLPGPTSTQTATTVGIYRAGWLGGLLALFLFQWPGMALMLTLGLLMYSGHAVERWRVLLLRLSVGLAAAAMSQVALASFTIIRAACGDDRLKLGLATAAATIGVLVPADRASYVYPLTIAAGGAAVLCRDRWRRHGGSEEETFPVEATTTSPRERTRDIVHHESRWVGTSCLALFASITALAAGVSVAGAALTSVSLRLFATSWRLGTTVFGGGQVVLPMMLKELVAATDVGANATAGTVPNNAFMLGFSLVQAIPGPLFNLSVFIGAAADGVLGAVAAGAGLFAPGILLLFGVLPFWDRVRQAQWVRLLVQGLNATAAGLILAGCWMLLRRAVYDSATFSILMLATYGALCKVPVALTILGGGIVGLAVPPARNSIPG
ncbi:hypothetical protein CDCA_CDCA13G3564 [Cyanidium caldarium]|uniref:Chromate transporter n=1 Tax=Cyanidium caldarium TaxID=2771 RepID=A0AAV9IZ43_CYACA|nr:hypothetical protein CDCA_CDCA13G3564 [Cyanidium caldarium]